MKLQDKTAIITGSGWGIGKAIAKTLGLEGAKVIVNDVVKEEAERVAQELREIGIEALGLQADLTDEAQVEKLLEKGLV